MIHVLIGMLLVAFLTIGGTIVDVGLARLAQRQMVHATDAASLEGMRLQDAAPETTRRESARETLRSHFDDDFGATATDRAHYGAGPLITLSPGTGTIGANRQVQVADGRVYKPDPQLNLPNAAHGDMVEGSYDLTDLDHREAPDYTRSDFAPSSAPPGLQAFLVRLRRTRNERGLDNVPAVSSAAPELPYLFGHASTLDPGIKDRGITVRATSVAAGRRATMIGLPDPAAGVIGASPFLLELEFWGSLPTDETVTLPFGGNNRISGGRGTGRGGGGPPEDNPYDGPASPPIIPPGQVRARGDETVGVLDHRLDETRRAWSIGDRVAPDEAMLIPDVLTWLGNPEDDGYEPRVFYVPIYDADGELPWDGRPGNSDPPPFDIPVPDPVDKKDAQSRIVGFGAVLVVGAEQNEGNGNGNRRSARILIRKLPGFVAPLNASAVSTPGLAGVSAEAVMERHKLVDQPLRAAALVR